MRYVEIIQKALFWILLVVAVALLGGCDRREYWHIKEMLDAKECRELCVETGATSSMFGNNHRIGCICWYGEVPTTIQLPLERQ